MFLPGMAPSVSALCGRTIAANLRRLVYTTLAWATVHSETVSLCRGEIINLNNENLQNEAGKKVCKMFFIS